ncbi:MAG: helix-turn-helix domain-containing protein [Phycisphaerales bacterium]|nr:helix-turn-helix domain-containing protein [Phycisphaerales bacterium]
MPRLTRIRTAALAELASQLRFTPARAVPRLLRRIEDLAAEIDPARTYPEDWARFRITGFREDAADPAMLVGEALLGDLSALAEHLSSHARLRGGDAGEAELLTLDDLRARWRCSAKTVERARRAGLVGRRIVAHPDGPPEAQRLVFSERAVRGFEARRGERGPPGAAGAPRLTDVEAARARRWARGYRTRTRPPGPSLHRVAARIAMRLGRSTRAIAQLLLRDDAERASRGEAPLFERRARLDARQRRLAFRAWRAGVSVAAIAGRLGRSRATVHRLINERRYDLLRRLGLPLPEGRGAAHVGPNGWAALEAGPPPRGCTAPEFVMLAEADGPPDAELERARARAFQALRRRAGEAVASIDRRAISAERLDAAETDLRSAARLKAILLRAQFGLMLRSIEQHLAERGSAALRDQPGPYAGRLIASAVEAASGAIDRFDPEPSGRAGRLAAPVALAVARALAEPSLAPSPPAGPPARRSAVKTAPAPDPLEQWPRRVAPWQAWLDAPAGLADAAAGLAPDDAALLAARYGWADGRARTCAELGVPPERLARAVRRAVRAARARA